MMHATNTYHSQPVSQGLRGQIRVPGDKSISHRAVILASLAEGESRISGLLEGEDVLATLAAFRAMGVQAEGPASGDLTIRGVGMRGLNAPQAPLDMGNSGTAMRLLCGLLAAQQFASTLIGDASLSQRPMRRVTVPLSSMGARCATDDNGCPPIHIRGSKTLEPIDYQLPMASAQVKSAVLLAGLYAQGETSVKETAPTRDHTERMLQAFGYPCQVIGGDRGMSTIAVQGGGQLVATDIDVPADISSAAFFIVAASIVPGSDITLKHVGINPTRIGIISILEKMGANISTRNPRQMGGEPVADLRVTSARLRGIDIAPELIPLAIDEIPVICVAAACAQGTTTIRGAEELRHKESDRISAVVAGLREIGIEVIENKDGMQITGGQIYGGHVQSKHDHRIAMAFGVAGAVAKQPITIDDCQNVATSYPNFLSQAAELGMQIEAQSHD